MPSPAPVNLYSDTQTRPTAEMRQAMAAAEVGDEQRMLDPTTRELERRVAELLGQEAAVFMPTGTMCNQIALRLHIRPGGDEVMLHRGSHPVNFEAGGPAQLAGAMARDTTSRGRSSSTKRSPTRSAPRDGTSPGRGWCAWSRPPTWAAAGSGR